MVNWDVLRSVELESFMVHWNIPLCQHGQVHSPEHNWFDGLYMGIFVYKCGLNSVFFQPVLFLSANWTLVGILKADKLYIS